MSEYEKKLKDYDEIMFDKLTGKYKHYCWEWDGLPVDEHGPEFASCSCFPSTPEIIQLQDYWSKEIDKMNESGTGSL